MKTVVFLRTNPIDPDPRIEKQARTLARAGWVVFAVGWDRSKQLPPEQKMDMFTVYRIGPKSEFGTGFRNLGGLILWQWDLLKWLWRSRNKYTHIHAADLDTLLPALALKLLSGKLVVYDIFDFFSESRKGPRLFKKLARFLELKAICLADATILVDESRVAQIRGSKPKRLEFILNSPEEFDITTNPSRALTESSAQLRIVFVGFLQDQRWLFEMLDLVEKHPSWHFDLAGFGDLEVALEARIKNIPNARFHGRISHSAAMELSARADVLFAIYDPSLPNHKYSSANKLFEAMMLGKPILVARDTGMDQTVAKYDLGFVVDYKSSQEVEDRLKQIAQWDTETRQAFSARVREVYSQRFSWKIMSERLIKLYDSLEV
ncbi:MAG: glycosyltransferase family 4 protein [Thermaceae bacterium]|nr:glycosyltransferase family 4 protein [Thermaceae bacterium]